MQNHRFSSITLVFALAFALLSQGMMGASAKGKSGAKLKGTILIGQITTTTGPLLVYGQNEVQGFQIGLSYATNGTMKVDSAKLKVKTYNDAGSTSYSDPTLAATNAKNAIENDHAQILQCCSSSTSALAVAKVASDYKKILMVAPAAADQIAGVNRYTFRTSRESTQDALTGAAYAAKKFGKTYMAIAQNNVFGQGQIAAWKGQLDRLGATDAGDVLFPTGATDFTPYISQIMAKKPNWLFLACAGTECLTLAKQMDQQGLLDQIKVVTGLGNNASFGGYGDAGTKIGYISVYYYKFPKTKANAYLIKEMKKRYKRVPDIFDQDSFAAAQQLVAALKKTHSTDASKLIKVLEGQTVQGPKGPYTIRKADHVCLQPMYIAQLVGSGTNFSAKLIAVRSPKQTTPPVQQHNW